MDVILKKKNKISGRKNISLRTDGANVTNINDRINRQLRKQMRT